MTVMEPQICRMARMPEALPRNCSQRRARFLEMTDKHEVVRLEIDEYRSAQVLRP